MPVANMIVLESKGADVVDTKASKEAVPVAAGGAPEPGTGMTGTRERWAIHVPNVAMRYTLPQICPHRLTSPFSSRPRDIVQNERDQDADQGIPAQGEPERGRESRGKDAQGRVCEAQGSNGRRTTMSRTLDGTCGSQNVVD